MVATAARSNTKAVASLSRLSPSRIVTTRLETGFCLMIEVATASVGLTMAPRAAPKPKPRPGMTSMKKTPSSKALRTTSSTDRPLIAVNSRRKFIEGIDTAAE